MRPPYSPQMIPYTQPPNGYQPPTHMAQQHHGHQVSPTSMQSPSNRARGGMPISPAMSHSPIYPPSPMLMHAHPNSGMQVPQHHTYPLPAGRGQPPRADGGVNHLGGSQPGQQQPPPPHLMYPSVPPAPYAPRPAW